MVENNNSTILEFQGPLAWLIWWELFHLIWEVKKQTRPATHARAPPLAGPGSARAGRGEARQAASGRGVVVLIFSTH
jgi:hypothetical protein